MPDSLKDIELRHLKYFLAAAEYGSFRKAGLNIGIRESGVSRQICHLEECLGVDLFHRHHSGVKLTAAGRQFMKEIRIGMDQIVHAARGVSVVSEISNGRILVGMFSSLNSQFLSELFQSFLTTYSGISVDFTDGPADDHITSLHRNIIDVALWLAINVMRIVKSGLCGQSNCLLLSRHPIDYPVKPH